MTIEVEKYLEEIIGEIDFSALNDFLNGHMRTEMSFRELVAAVSANGLEALSRENITTFVFDSVLYELSLARPMFVKMLVFSLLFSITHRLLVTKNKYVSDICFLVIYAILMVLLMQSFFLVKEIALEGIDALLMFINALIPTYAATMVFTGSAVSGAMLYEIAFFIVYLVEFLMKNFISPVICVFVLVLFLNHLFDEDKLSKMAQFIELGVGLLLKTTFGVVIGLGVVQSLLTSAKDRLASNTILSGMSSIPGVGNMVGSTGEIILSCGMLIKNSIGVIGLIIIFIMAVIPVTKIGCFWIMYHLISITLQPVADNRITECVSAVARGCDLYLKMLVYSMMLFFMLFSMIAVATTFVF